MADPPKDYRFKKDGEGTVRATGRFRAEPDGVYLQIETRHLSWSNLDLLSPLSEDAKDLVKKAIRERNSP